MDEAGPSTSGVPDVAIDSDNYTNERLSEGVNEKKNRPKGTRLRQQKLPAWQPILTASTVIPAFAAVGIFFLPIGIFLFLASENVQEYVMPYTDCTANHRLPDPDDQLMTCSAILKRNFSNDHCNCTATFYIKKPIRDTVYFYYGLRNFYQNHRRYVKSRSDAQLLGNLQETTDCDPYAKLDGKAYAPCGAVANSMFNDTFKLYYINSPLKKTEIKMSTKGVAWDVDRNKKFKNPPGNLSVAFANTLKPPNWRRNIWELDTEDAANNGFENVDFMVWMRTAALPNFRKLYRTLDSSSEFFADGLPAGNYTLEIEYNYPVSEFRGEKTFVVATTSWAGAKNPFLGVAYMAVGVLCLLLAVVFLVIHLKFGKSLSEISNIRTTT